MRGYLFRRLALTVVCAAGLPGLALAQQHQHQHASSATTERLGTVDFPNSGNAAAQAPFLTGLKYLHNFEYDEAAAAFQQAQKADPDFALAYWGEAMAQNYTLWAEQYPDKARAALSRLGPTPEARAAKAKTDREKMWLAAVEALYGSGSKFERDVAYADRMDALFKAYPDDTEARVFDALATMGRSHGTRDTAAYLRAALMLEPVFKANPQHPGAVHYLIHAYDEPSYAQRGLPMARVYNKIAPDSAHAQHMTSHIFLALGMWPEVEQANLDARAAVERVMGRPVPELSCGHGGIWLVYAKLQQGKPVTNDIADCAKATIPHLAKPADSERMAGDLEGGSGSHADMRARNFVETGELVAPLELPKGELFVARFLYAYGDVLAARHDATKAQSALASLEASHAVLPNSYAKEHPDDKQSMPWLDLALLQARGVTALAAGRQAEGITILRDAAAREASLPPAFGPPQLQKPGWELLGDELLAAGDKPGAAAAYRQSLKLQPGRRLSLAGLAKATH